MAEERFKTTLMGGFDKDDVLNQVREMKDAAYAEKSKLIKELTDKIESIEDVVVVNDLKWRSIFIMASKK